MSDADHSLLTRLQHLRRPLVMGILNVTPDSFSDGGRYTDVEAALAHARRLVAEGADLIDVGGESTRPGAEPVDAKEELARVLPVIEACVAELAVPISIDTSKPRVMREATRAGAQMINDVRALQHRGALKAAAESGAVVTLMHMQGTPRTMQTAPQYESVVGDIMAFFKKRLQACRRAGIPRERLVIDPGFGFGKTLAHNYTLLRELYRFTELGLPVMAGLSRKSMIGDLLDIPVGERQVASAILAALAAERGASILRVHDVRETVQAIRLVEATLSLGVENEHGK